ncbi:hypothetical protein H4582DRAFT_2124753, partial [Lactarius indigo]
MPQVHQPYPTLLTAPGRPMSPLILRHDFVEMDELSRTRAQRVAFIFLFVVLFLTDGMALDARKVTN